MLSQTEQSKHDTMKTINSEHYNKWIETVDARLSCRYDGPKHTTSMGSLINGIDKHINSLTDEEVILLSQMASHMSKFLDLELVRRDLVPDSVKAMILSDNVEHGKTAKA